MNWTWQEVAGFCAFLGFLWEIIRRITNAMKVQAGVIERNALAKAEAQNKATADKERTEALWAITDIQKEMIESIIDHLSLPPEIRAQTPFHRRRMGHNLEKKARKRLESYDSGFTEFTENDR